MIGGDVDFYATIYPPADFLSVFARGGSAVTPSEKVQLTAQKFTVRFPMSLR